MRYRSGQFTAAVVLRPLGGGSGEALHSQAEAY